MTPHRIEVEFLVFSSNQMIGTSVSHYKILSRLGGGGLGIVYEAMQRIKANPLLEQVYRQIVMPLLDQLMAGVKQAQAAKTAPLEQVPPPADAPAGVP